MDYIEPIKIKKMQMFLIDNYILNFKTKEKHFYKEIELEHNMIKKYIDLKTYNFIQKSILKLSSKAVDNYQIINHIQRKLEMRKNMNEIFDDSRAFSISSIDTNQFDSRSLGHPLSKRDKSFDVNLTLAFELNLSISMGNDESVWFEKIRKNKKIFRRSKNILFI